MFNLEEAISDWRRRMRAAGVQTPAPLEELEMHLREDVERKMQPGLSAQEAFETAARAIGSSTVLGAEFKKIEATTARKQIYQTAGILAALFGTVVGGAMVMPALGRWRDTGVLHLWPLLAGSGLVMIAGCAAIYGVRAPRRPRGGKLISVVTIAAASFYVVPLIQAFFIRKTDWMGWIFCILLAVASISFYGACLYLIRQSPAPPNCKG